MRFVRLRWCPGRGGFPEDSGWVGQPCAREGPAGLPSVRSQCALGGSEACSLRGVMCLIPLEGQLTYPPLPGQNRRRIGGSPLIPPPIGEVLWTMATARLTHVG